MLHVFHVDSGRMITFDMSLALESVENLKRSLQEESKIAVDKQVLLISGGESLESDKRVCSYSAGTDTNPIFLFSKSSIESPKVPLLVTDYPSESEIEAKVRDHTDMPVSFTTVSKRAQLAQVLHEHAKKQLSTCEGLVHDQHLQHQGWSAVVANLEDITLDFSKRSEIFERSFNDYMDERESYLVFLEHFQNDLELLRKIPVLSELLQTEDGEAPAKTSSEEGAVKEVSLYEWMSAADTQSTMDQLYDHCSRGLEQFDREAIKKLTGDVHKMLEATDNPKMKAVKGVGERLSGLETLMREVKKHVQNQGELAQAFAANQNRANNTKDPTVLPNLCMSHKKQLQMMSHNHERICDIERRCIKAKEELCVNINLRLRWVMYIEDQILEHDQKLVIYHENLKRLRRHLEVLQQIHLAPATYLCAVAEVVRRRAFSQTFLLWASELACHLLTIHKEEVARRKEFHAMFDGHFITTLFPGMDDMPPSFATQAPPAFDAGLPRLGDEDVERLKRELPELARHLNVPDSTAIANFFTVKSLVKKEEEEEEEEKRDREEAKEESSGLKEEQVLSATAHGLSHLKDLDECCESETDVEGFENVGQSPSEVNSEQNVEPATQDASTSTEDNLQVSRSEHDRLRDVLSTVRRMAVEATQQLRRDIAGIRQQVVSEREQCQSMAASWNEKHRDVLVGLIRHEEGERDEKLRRLEQLSNENGALEAELVNARRTLEEEMRARLAEKDAERERAVKEVRERMGREHKDEIEGIRSRFKLMSLQRSPSETNVAELCGRDKVEEAVRIERERCEREAERREMEAGRAAEDRVHARLEEARERERKLTLECVGYCHKIRGMEEVESRGKEMARKMTELQKRNAELEQRMVELSEWKRPDPTEEGSPIPVMAHSVAPVQTAPKVTVDSCKPNDVVVIAWDPEHENYRVLQDNKHLYFLHSDYLEGMGLEVRDARPNKVYAVGEVIDKEYCSAKKSENRYKVPKLTKFFRVKVKALPADRPPRVFAQSVYEPKSPREEDASRMTCSHSSDPSSTVQPPSSPGRPAILETDEAAHFAEDSGIVENFEQASSSLDETLVASGCGQSESSDRTDESVLTENEAMGHSSRGRPLCSDTRISANFA